MTINDLNLAPIMRFRAEQLQAKFPSVVYLSGRRGAASQAAAMAGNHLEDDTYLVRTYRHGQDFLDAIHRLPVSEQQNRYYVSKAIEGLLITQPLLLVWTHKDGNAVDLAPMEDADGQPTAEGLKVMAWIRECDDTTDFRVREGHLIRWHWSTRAADQSEEV